MIQLVSPNLSTVGNIGWCLSFVENVFSTPHVGDTATDAWQSTQFPHDDRDLPAGVYVPIWFSYFEGGINYGHVAVHAPDGRVLSSPYAQENTHVWFSSIDQCAQVLNCTYLGWSEDLAGIKIVDNEGVPPMPTEQQVKDTVKGWLGYDPSPDQIRVWTTNYWWVLMNDVIPAYAEKQAGDIKAIQAKVDALTTANQKLADQLTALNAQPVVSPDPSVTVTQSGLWAAFKRFLGIG